jgi:peptidoglycan-associated lipoprotein
MIHTTRIGAVALVLSLPLAGCATKGDVESVMDQQAALREAIEQERSDRMAGDEELSNELSQLRSDLQALKDDFGAQIEAVARGLQFALPVHFAYDEAEVRPSAQSALERFASVVNKHYAGATVTVEGFADPAGSETYNRDLAQRRAESVRDRLMEIGVEAQLRAVGYGEDRLVVPGAEADDPGAELNRRVVFVIESPSASMEMAPSSMD